MHTLSKFFASPEVHEIIVALRKDEIAGFRTQLEKQYPEILNKRLQLVEGGEHRQDSVASALAAVSARRAPVLRIPLRGAPFFSPPVSCPGHYLRPYTI